MSKFLEIRSKNKDICTLGECGGSITSILQYLLETKVVDGVLNIKKYDDIYDGVPVFITDPKEILETAGSLHCAPTMVADLISEYLGDKKLAVVVKPCDAMAINELVKRNRFSSENLFIISLNCGGTLMPEPAQRMFELFYDLNPENIIKEEIDKGQIIVLLKDGILKTILTQCTMNYS